MQRHFKIAALAAAVLSTFNASAADESMAPEVVVTATRFKDNALTKPLSVTVITEEEIAQSGGTSLPDLVSQKAGVLNHDLFGNNGAYATVDIRGWGAAGGQNTLILLDGRRLSDMDSSFVQWSTIPKAAIERIEIVRGAGAVLYGDGASGGIINIITKAPGASGNAGVVTARVGSYGTRDLQIHASHGAGPFSMAVSAGHLDSDGYRKNNATHQTNAQADLKWQQESDEIRVTLGGDWQDIRLPGPRLVDWGLGRDDYQSDRRGTPTPGDYSGRDGQQLAIAWRHQTGLGEFAMDVSRRERNTWISSSTMFKYRDTDLALNAISPRLRIDHALGQGTGRLVLGFDWQGWDYSFSDAMSKATVGTPFSKVSAQQNNLGFYLQETADLSKNLSLLAGARTESQHLSGRNTVNPAAPGWDFAAAAPNSSIDNREWAAELGMRYRLSSTWAATGKLSRAFRFANIDETFEYDNFFNNSFAFLRPQTNRLVEAGVEWKEGAARAKANLFQNDVDNEIHLDAFTAGIGNTNLPPSRRRGLELEAGWLPLDSVRLDAAYTFTSAKFRDGILPGTFGLLNNVIAGKNVPLVPRHKLNLGASWEFMANTHLGGNFQYVASQFMDNDEANDLGATIPAYRVFDLKLDHQMGAWLFSANINNLFNEQYYAYAVKSQFTPGRFNTYPLPERNMMFSAEYRFE